MTIGWKSLREAFDKRGLRTCSWILLFARALMRGAVLRIGVDAMMEVFKWLLVTEVAPVLVLSLSEADISDSVSEYLWLGIRRICLRGRRVLPSLDCSSVMLLVMAGGNREGDATVLLRTADETGTLVSDDDGGPTVRDEKLRSISSRVSSIRRLWASMTSSSVVSERRGRDGILNGRSDNGDVGGE